MYVFKIVDFINFKSALRDIIMSVDVQMINIFSTVVLISNLHQKDVSYAGSHDMFQTGNNNRPNCHVCD